MAELVEEVVEDVIEEIANGRYIRGRFAVLTGVLGSIAGAAVGAYFTDRRLQKRYEKIAEEEIDVMRSHFRARLVAKEEKPDLDQMVRKSKEKAEVLGYTEKDLPPADPVPAAPGEPNTPAIPEEVRNVFEEQAPDHDWNYEVELAIREELDGKRPYVIHIDEKGEAEYDEITLTYYAGDDVLCNSDDTIVESQEEVVGVNNLDRFGHGSGDRSIVYVRNDNLSLDIEVVRSEQTYAEEVHGFKHEKTPPRRRRQRLDE